MSVIFTQLAFYTDFLNAIASAELARMFDKSLDTCITILLQHSRSYCAGRVAA